MKAGKIALVSVLVLATVGLIYAGYKLLKNTKGKAKKKICEGMGGTWDGVECKTAGGVIDPIITPTTTVVADFPLKYGSFGDKVGKIQEALNKLGASLTVDNDFGNLTQAALNKAGYGTVVEDEAEYNKIIAAASTAIAAARFMKIYAAKIVIQTYKYYSGSISKDTVLSKKVADYVGKVYRSSYSGTDTYVKVYLSDNTNDYTYILKADLMYLSNNDQFKSLTLLTNWV